MDSGFVHDARVDNWSLGATMYMVLCGTGPFGKEGKKLLVDENGEIEFTAKISEDAKVLVRRLMMDKPEDRIGIREVLTDAWITLPTEADLRKHDLRAVKLIFEKYDAVPLVFGEYDAATVQVVLPEPTYKDNYREPEDSWQIRSTKQSVAEKSWTISEDAEYEEE
jgi:serine/threonine protein kinase